MAAARAAYAERRLAEAGRLLIAAIDDFARYAGWAARHRDRETLASVGATVAEAVRRLHAGFSPVCPYLFDKLAAWTAAQAATQSTALETPREAAAAEA